MYDPDQNLLQVKVTLEGVEPPIWRRLLLPKSLNFAQLHELLQAAFSWTDSHLHQFVVGGLRVGAPETDDEGLAERITLEATEIHLRDLDLMHLPSPRILYEYDFGDGWRHWIEFETEIPSEPGQNYPVLVDGARRGPPEDVGGPDSYAEFLESWSDPNHEEHKSNRRWAGRAFNPETFDRDKLQKAVNTALKRCRGNYRFRSEEPT